LGGGLDSQILTKLCGAARSKKCGVDWTYDLAAIAELITQVCGSQGPEAEHLAGSLSAFGCPTRWKQQIRLILRILQTRKSSSKPDQPHLLLSPQKLIGFA